MLEVFAILAAFSATSSAADTEIKELSDKFYSLEIAEFSKKIPIRERHERQAERIAKKADCKLPTDIGWVHARVDVALEVSASGRVIKVVPVDTGCRVLENYVVAHLNKYAGRNGAVLGAEQGKWFRQSVTFRWPE